MPATLTDLANRFGCEYRGDAHRVISRVATLADADSSSIAFLANPKFRAQLANTRAGAVILEAKHVSECPADCLIHANPYATYARVAAFLHPPAPASPGIASSAVLAADATVPASASIGAQAVIGGGAVIGQRVSIGAGCVIGGHAEIGDDSRIGPRVVLSDRVKLGRRCIVHPGAVIGADGFGFAPDQGDWVKVPQLGGVSIGDDVEIGANTTIDRGTIEDTVIEDGVKLDNLVQIAHNARIGAHTVMAAMSGVAGSSRLGQRCMIGGGAVLINHIELCDDVVVLFRSVVTKSIRTPGVYSGSLPAEEVASWRRKVARFRSLDRLAERLRVAEGRLEGLAGLTGADDANGRNTKDE